MATWSVEWYIDRESGAIPALAFLRAIPASACMHLMAIRDAVRHTGPERWRDTTSHRLMRGELDFMYEARDRHDDTLYRLFLIWDRERSEVVMLDGRSKPNGTTIHDADYEALAALGRSVLATEPRPYATVDDLATWSLQQGPGS